ncbi:MAG TPA: hypothetical protein VMZ92_07650 [Planctomycetota bacterium]|nr:hypothetical protein [Planctomycetota bacterium]
MKTAVGIILALLTVEGVVLAAWPGGLRAVIADSSDRTLRVVGIIEILLVLVIGLLAFGAS